MIVGSTVFIQRGVSVNGCEPEASLPPPSRPPAPTISRLDSQNCCWWEPSSSSFTPHERKLCVIVADVSSSYLSAEHGWNKQASQAVDHAVLVLEPNVSWNASLDTACVRDVKWIG